MIKCILVVALLVIATQQTIAADQPPPDQSPPTTLTGRYQIVFSPHMRADTFLLDTETGRVWSVVKFSELNGEPVVWEPMVRLDSEAEEIAWMAKIGFKPAPSPSAAVRPSVQPQRRN